MARLWRNDPEIQGPKYSVKRRDGSIPEWPWFVLGAKDPAAPYALRAYADAAESLGMDPYFIADIRQLAADFTTYLAEHGQGDPDAARHRTDDPAIVAEMVNAKGL